MNEEIPAELQDFSFNELTNNQQNIWRLRDELNATRRWIRENAIDVENEEEEIDQVIGTLKPEVQMTKNGKFYIPGKGFIKKENAYL